MTAEDETKKKHLPAFTFQYQQMNSEKYQHFGMTHSETRSKSYLNHVKGCAQIYLGFLYPKKMFISTIDAQNNLHYRQKV